MKSQTKQHLQTVQQEQTFHSSTTTVTESVNIVEEVTFQEVHEISEDRGCNTGLLMVPDEEGGPVITEAISPEIFSEEVILVYDVHTDNVLAKCYSSTTICTAKHAKC